MVLIYCDTPNKRSIDQINSHFFSVTQKNEQKRSLLITSQLNFNLYDRHDCNPRNHSIMVKTHWLTRLKTLCPVMIGSPYARSWVEDILCCHGCSPINKIISIDETSITSFMFSAYSRCASSDTCIHFLQKVDVMHLLQ
ncbi:unnamed protein product [Albugo candida]|uniref:Uncharacterized protein n=1 Tax=Albugo candida TaxID=65357 RepID=A0A024GII0_9STRA|nr:unnamed protein product [Albugo candida]|eukprot:CCI46327.1 unnamed protein product [Albugo candida]